MNRKLFIRLGVTNIKKNKETYYPFMIAMMLMVAMFYTIESICLQTDITTFLGDETVHTVLQFGVVVVGIIATIVCCYANSFVIRKRIKELGLYQILGMEKKHIGKVVFYETVMVGVVSLVSGIVCGMLFSKLIFWILLYIMKLTPKFAFAISATALKITVILFLILVGIMIAGNYLVTLRLKPIELLQGSKKGEREPKAKWLMTVIGLALLGAGYGIALKVENPIASLNYFFGAVLLVIAGTYCMFIAGSVTILKVLQTCKRVYYQKKNFAIISGMIYRMKQNATGLATICILSTSVLITISTTVSLYAGFQHILEQRFPNEVSVSYHITSEQIPQQEEYKKRTAELITTYAKEHNVSVENENAYLDAYQIGRLVDEQEIQFANDENDEMIYAKTEDYLMIHAISQDCYRKMSGDDIALQDNELAYYFLGKRNKTKLQTLTIDGKEFQVAAHISKNPGIIDEDVIDSLVLIVPDMSVLQDIASKMELQGEQQVVSYDYSYDLQGTIENKTAYCEGIRGVIYDANIEGYHGVEDYYTAKEDIFALLSSLFFIGVYIGFMFLVATVLIIYYKQISEGYQDRERFRIMIKVGLSRTETKQMIHTQILWVFFLPIIVAVIHIAFAFHIVTGILALFRLTNVGLFIGCTIGTLLIFCLVYGLVYMMTARTYYRIVNEK